MGYGPLNLSFSFSEPVTQEACQPAVLINASIPGLRGEKSKAHSLCWMACQSWLVTSFPRAPAHTFSQTKSHFEKAKGVLSLGLVELMRVALQTKIKLSGKMLVEILLVN